MTTESRARFLPITTGQNFRDMGGYATTDGRSVRWGQLFRSGFMASIAGDDLATIRALGVDTICDLRDNEERTFRPTRWQEGTATDLWSRDHDFSAGSLAQLAEDQHLSVEIARARMLDVYRVLPQDQIDSYRELLTRLASGRVPMVFNCSAGKDRTGLAAGLILTVLGVERATIEADYLLSNTVLAGLVAFMKASPKYSALVTERPHLALPMLRVEPDYLAASFAVIEREHGTVARYLAEAVGIDAAMQEAIRANLLD